MTIVGMMIGGLGIGWMLDEKLGTRPLWTAVGLCAGAFCALNYLYRWGKQHDR